MTQALTNEHYEAYALHPKYQGELLDTEERNIVHQWLVNKNPDFISTLLSFQAKGKPFLESFFSKLASELDPVTWWRAAQANGISPEFVNIAIQLLDAPCSSAAIERVFSNFSFIHTKIRNRLGNEKASKMVFCYRFLRGSKELDY